MAKSIKLGADTYLDASGVEVNSTSSSLRTTLQDWTGSMQGIRSTLVAVNSSVTFTLASGARVIFIANGTDNTKNIYLVSCNSSGGVAYSAFGVSSKLTVSTGTNTITFSNTSGGSAQIVAFATSYYITNIA